MNKQSMRIIFFGTPEFAAVILRRLIENKYNVAAVVAQPDKKIGRKQEVIFSPVKKIAVKNGIRVLQPDSSRDSRLIRDIMKIGVDLFIVAAYGKILPKDILEIPKYGAINIHASLLPKYRGASPVQCAILEGERETGITLMKMNEKMDEGDILEQRKIKIGENETADTLLDKLSHLGAKMILKFIPEWTGGKINPNPQNNKIATYCKPIQREDGKINWNLNAEEIYRRWRAYHPWPGVFTLYKVKNNPKRLKLIEIKMLSNAETGEKTEKIIKYNKDIAVKTKRGLIVLKRVQLEGKKEMNIEDFVMGYPYFVGSKFN